MRAEDLELKELLELLPDRGSIQFAGQRALLLDATAMGLLRKYLVENFGTAAARVVLTQFGFAQGWRLAEAMRAGFKWDTDRDWGRAGTRLHALAGLYCLDRANDDPLDRGGTNLVNSYEAEQHLLHFGRSTDPTCWTICGLISGYASRTSGEEVFVLEDRCVGRGDATCHVSGRTRSEWGKDRADDLRVYSQTRLKDCLDVSLSRVTETLRAAEQKLNEHRRVLVAIAPDTEWPLGFIAKSPSMRRAVTLARRVAQVDSTVLITGESGAGKERFARLVHEESPRAAGPFIAVNCGAITETLLESELFGHARGSFTGASQDRPGLFESANKGTILLDEVGEVSPGMQVKLLRALQEREIRRVGENRVRKIDVRIVAATNRDLAIGVAGGGFRQDLYYRLKVVELHVPALRERREDILPLARVLLEESAIWMKRKISGFSPAAADQLLRYEWPGNVRELENAMERAVALAPGARVELEDLPDEVLRAPKKPVINFAEVRPMDEIEREYILSALELNGGNQTRTAEQLQIGSATLYRKLKSYGMLGAGKPGRTSS